MRGARMFGRRNVAVASIVSAIAVASLVFGSVTPADADAPQTAQSESPTQVPGLPITKPADVHPGSPLGSSSALAAPGNLTPAPTGTVNEPTPTAEDPDENAASNGIAEGSQITSRSTYENVWTNPDGTTTDQMSLTPINTKDSSGKWVDVNSTVAKTASGDYTATDNPVQPTFASSTSDSTDYSVQSATTGAKVSFELEGEHDADAHKPTADQVDASDQADASVSKGVAYDDVLKNTDASYQVSDSGVKESLILAVPPTSANPSYTWDVHAPGLTLTDGPNGSVLFQDSDGKTVFYTPTPLMTDSSGVPGASSDAVDTIPLTLKHMSGADWTMTLTPDATWLNDPARIYPVSLDPSMQNGSPNITAYESSGNNKILATEPYANVGNSQSASPYSIWRSVGTYPYNQTFGKTILSAQLLEQENNNGTAAAEGTQAGWAAAYNYNCNATRVTGSSFTAGMTGTADIDVTALVQYWVSQRSDGGSFCLQASESATQYTYKQINTQLYIQYENTPTVVGAPTTVPDPNPGFPAQQTSPGAQATGLPTSSPATTSTTPTLNVNATQDPSNSPALQYQFFVSTNPNPTVSSTWWTPWMTAPSGAAPTGISATLPAGKLAPGTRYYWDAVVMDQYSIQGWTSIFSFTTTTLPTYGSAAAFSPSDNSIVASTTPTLTAPAATSTNGKPLNFEIRLTSGTDGVSGQIAQSPLCATSNSACVINGDGSVSWKVPASIMQDGGSYTWVEVINDNYGDYVYTANSTTGVNRLTVNTRVSDPGPAPTDSAGPVTVNLANGNASASFSSPTVHSVGGDMGMNFSYNSQLASNQGLTGTYWNLPTSTTTFGYSPMTAGATQALVRTDSSVNFTWGTAAPDDEVALSYFQAQWTGYMTPPDGTYEFGFQADDGVELQLGTTPIITDQWKNQHQTSPQMEAGPGQVLTVNGSTWSIGSQSGSLPIPITVNYYERMGVANVYLEAAAQSGSSWGTPQVVPANWFSKSPLLLPSGWASSAAIMGDAGEYVSASKQGGSVVVTDTDGGTHTFARTSSGGYTPPPGEQSVLSTDQSGNLVLTDESGTVYQFNSAGLVTSATPAVDVGSKPATPIPNYNSSRQLTSLSDPLSASGSTYTRQVQFSYLSNSTITTSTMSGSNYAAGSCAPSSGSTYATSVTTTSGGTQSDAGMLCQILYPGGTTTQLYYDANGQLARIVDPGNEVTDFSYTTGSHGQYLLSSIRNSLANDWLAANTTRNAAGPVTTDITYTADDKVATVTLPAPDGVTQSDRPQKTYTYTAADSNGNGTTYVDVAGLPVPTGGGSNGHASTVTFNSSLRETSSTTASGLTSSTVWNNHDDQLSAIDPQGHEMATTYDQEDRATATFGPAPAACVTAAQSAYATGGASPTCQATGLPVATSTMSYDGGMHALAATWYGRTDMAGAPAAYSLGIPAASGANGGATDGSINYDWSTSSAAVSPISGPTGTAVGGSTGQKWTASFTGLVTFPQAGTYTFYTYADDGTQLWINDQLVINDWGDHGAHIASATKAFTVTKNQSVRIRLNYLQDGGGARLQLAMTTGSAPGSYTAGDTVPAADLSPAYNLQTAATAHDSTSTAGTASQVTSTTTASAYTNPWYGGTATSTTVDPSGLNLTTSGTTESANGAGYLRQLTSTKPAGSATTSTNVYYGGTGGDAGAVTNTCGIPAGTPQFGMLETTKGPQAADGSQQMTTSVYDVFGRVVGTKSNGDTEWSCTTYDARGRTTTVSIPAFEGNAARTVTDSYTADGKPTGDPLTTTQSDSAGTITTVTDLLGRVTGYTDVWGTTTSSTYNQLSQLTSTSTKQKGSTSPYVHNFTYNVDGQITQVTDWQNILETVTYTDGVMTAVSEPTGTGTEGNGVTGTFSYDPTGAESGIAWSFPNGQAGVSDAVTRSQAGKILTDTLTDGSTTYASAYTYDAADRLTLANVPWNTLTYGFAPSGGCGANAAAGADGNRTSFTDSTDGSATPFTMSYCYDNADRLTSDSELNVLSGADTLASTALSSTGASPNLVYDAHGNTTTLADQTLTYDGADRLTSITSTGGSNPSNAATISYIRDATDRVVSETTTSGGTTSTKHYSYTDGSDSADYVMDGSGNITDRLGSLPGGVSTDAHGTTSGVWSYPDIHGDTIVTADVVGTRSSGISLYDPFGDPIDPVTHRIGTYAADGDQPANLDGTTTSFGWEGSHEKVTDHAGDISGIEMGARQYVPLLGRFLQVDPVAGGNVNDYVWPVDPTNQADLSGDCAECDGGAGDGTSFGSAPLGSGGGEGFGGAVEESGGAAAESTGNAARDAAEEEERKTITGRKLVDLARRLGYRETRQVDGAGRKGAKVFTNGKRFISKDTSGHGGFWRVWESKADFEQRRNTERWNMDLTRQIRITKKRKN